LSPRRLTYPDIESDSDHVIGIIIWTDGRVAWQAESFGPGMLNRKKTLGRLLPLAILVSAFAPVADATADAVFYGRAHLSVDYVDADANAAWNRPAPGAPFFDMEQFIDDANDVLGDIGYVGVPGPGGINTAIADVLFGTLDGNFPFSSLPADTQAGILRALDDATQVGAAFNGWTLDASDRGSRFGIKGSEDLGGGLQAIYQIEIAVELSGDPMPVEPGKPDGFRLRNSFVGLAGDWGTGLTGRHDTALKMSTGRLDLFADTLADYNYTVGFNDLRIDRALHYVSPIFYGFQIAGSVAPAGGSTLVGAANPDADGLAEIWSVATTYRNGPFFASAAYELIGKEHWRPQEGAYDTALGLPPNDDKKWRIGLGLLDWRGLTLTGVYESREDILGMPERAAATMWQVQAGYAFGNNMIKAMYGQADLDACSDPGNTGFRYTCSVGVLGQVLGPELAVAMDQKDKSTWALGLDHRFSQRTNAYVLYTALKDDDPDADWSGLSLGLSHWF